MANALKLHIITPDGEFYNEPDQSVERIIIKTTEGDMGILYDHIPTTVALASGPVVIVKDGKKMVGVIHGGFAEIKEDMVTLLSDAAEWPQEIDAERAKRAKKRAEEILAEIEYNENPEKFNDAKAAHERAISRLDILEWVDKN